MKRFISASIFLFALMFVLAIPAFGAINILHNFAGGHDDGKMPGGSLIFSEETLYGMTSFGGDYGRGTIFSIPAAGGPITLLHEFAGGSDDGEEPYYGSLILSEGTLYGMTYYGGDEDYDNGTIFSIPAAGGPITLLHKFAGGSDDGEGPYGSLIISDGTLYGMTFYGGDDNYGTIFSIPAAGGPITLLHEFAGGSDDGKYPRGSLIFSDGTLYGMTSYGGDDDLGTIFSIPASGGPITLLHEFAGGSDDGEEPYYGSLILSEGILYGMTSHGGDDDLGTIFSIPAAGGPITLLHEFAGGPDDGDRPKGSLILSEGILYGMTEKGGDHYRGTVFSLPKEGGTITLSHEFMGGIDDGYFPENSLILSETNLYGMTEDGGKNGDGIIFKYDLSIPRHPVAPTGLSEWIKYKSITTDNLNGIWATDGPKAYAVGDNGTVLHFNGSSWSQMPSITEDNLNGVWGSTSNNVFAVGDGGRIQHLNGDWSQMSSNTAEDLKDICGVNGSDVFTLGDNGCILHYDGANWAHMTSNTAVNLNGIWCAAKDDVFAVGEGGIILHYNGTAWSEMSSYTTVTLHSVWGFNSSDVYAVGVNGAVGHWDGTCWNAVASGLTSASLYNIYGNGDEIFAVGQAGWMLKYNGTIWSTSTTGVIEDLNAAWGGVNSNGLTTVFVAGNNGTIIHNYREWGPHEVGKLLADDSEAGVWFGNADGVSIDGDTAIVGSYGTNSYKGAAYIFVKNANNWTKVAKLTASDGESSDYFGYCVSISGDTAVVGAAKASVEGNNEQGAAYIFKKPGGGWVDMTQTAKLTASDGEEGDSFGRSVSISGDTVVAGVYHYGSCGAAYLFEKPGSGWADMNETAKLTTNDGDAQYIGNHVSISGNSVIASGYLALNLGAVYLFEKPGSGWADMNHTAKLTASDSALGILGISLSISGDTVIAGNSTQGDAVIGSAYIFKKPVGGWADMNETAKLTPSDGFPGDWFGLAVSISNDTAIVGAKGDNGIHYHSGIAYVFEKPDEGWTDMHETDRISASDGMQLSFVGTAVGISGDIAIVGAYASDSNPRAYIYEKKTSVSPTLPCFIAELFQ